MASSKVGHIYIVDTVLTRPPKEKYAVCVCVINGFFVWINSLPRQHGKDQLLLAAGCHELIKHDSFMDLSRVVIHSEAELDSAKEFAIITKSLRDDVVSFISSGLIVMPPRHADIVRTNLTALPL